MKYAINFILVWFGVLFALPNMLPSSVNLFLNDVGIPVSSVPLGLDLAGGARLVLEMDLESLKEEKLLVLQGEIRQLLKDSSLDYDAIIVDEATLSVFADESNERPITNVIRAKVKRKYGSNYFVVASDPTEDGVKVVVNFTDDSWRTIYANVVSQTLEIIRKRVDAFGVLESQVYPYGDNRIVVEMPGVGTVALRNLIGKTAKLEIRVVESEAKNADIDVSPGYQLIKYVNSYGKVDFYVVEEHPILTGENMVSAQASYRGIMPVVDVKFDSVGAAKFAVLTKEHLGKFIAVLLDGKTITVLQLKNVIIDGSGTISGGFDTQEANNLAVLLQSGSLVTPMKILEEGYVGPELGEESLYQALRALGLAFVLITLFMCWQYGILGILSIISVTINMVVVLGIFTVMGIALSVAGVIAYVLTMGFNIDNNIYVLERLKESRLRGARFNKERLVDSINTAYKVSIPAILDSNLTNVVAAIILLFGTWILKAFAFSLLINVVVSVWSTFFISRTMLTYVANKWNHMLIKRGY